MNGYAAVCRALEAVGVDRTFGLPGTQTVRLFEAMRRSSIRHTLASHELGAAFMAIGYARATGKVGVLVTIGGPGLAYALPALAEASLDSVLLLHLVSATEVVPGRKDSLHRIDQPTIVSPLLKAFFRSERSPRRRL